VAFRSLNLGSLGWKWPLSHAVEVDAAARLVFVSGLTAKTPGGAALAPRRGIHRPGHMAARRNDDPQG
jgi:hypothetical protein